MRQVNVGVIGCGWISDVHLKSLNMIPEAKIIAVSDIIEDRAKEVALKYGIEKYYTDYKMILKDKEIDMVDILLPTELHHKVVMEALNSEKHVIVEKPIAQTVAEAEDIVDLVKKSKVKFMVAHNMRFWPFYHEVKRLIDEGKIGRPKLAMLMHRGWFWWKGAWTRWTIKKESGGPIVEVGIHGIDLLRWYLGEEPSAIYALARKVHFGLEVPDLIYITLEFNGNSIGSYEVNRTVIPGNYPFYHGVQVEGTEGSIMYYDSYNIDSLIYNVKGIYIRNQDYYNVNHGYLQELRHFIDCIIENKEPCISAEDAKKALEISWAAVKSAETGKPVEL
ncbi:MAG: Gfo/Idh/MocA family oxidoreductase [Nitrososphaerota archaeon]